MSSCHPKQTAIGTAPQLRFPLNLLANLFYLFSFPSLAQTWISCFRKPQFLQKNEVIFYEVVLKPPTLLINIPNFYSLRQELRLHNEANSINNCDRLKREQQQVELCPLSLQAGWESIDYFITVCVEKGVNFKSAQHSMQYFLYSEVWKITPNLE